MGVGLQAEVQTTWMVNGATKISIAYASSVLEEAPGEIRMMPVGEPWHRYDEATVITTDKPLTLGTLPGSYTRSTRSRGKDLASDHRQT